MKISMASLALAAMLFASTQAPAADDPKVSAEIMALARAQWAAEAAGKSTAEQTANTADDYTEFNQDFPTRLDGKDITNRLTEATDTDGGKALVGDMMNPKVQTYGDTAVLTYNFVGVRRDKNGVTTPSTAKSTRVYAKMGGKWMLVHANFAPVATKF